MLPAFLEKLGGFFDRRFIIAYWMPVFLGVCLMLGIGLLLRGPTQTLRQWDSASTTATTAAAVGGLMVITLLAFLLQAFSNPLMRLYIGYWPSPWFMKWGKARQTLVWRELQAKGRAEWYYSYPSEEKNLQPTRLGNVIMAAYDYPDILYSAQAALWWSRLTPLLPETFRGQVDNALTPLFALVNLCSLLIIGTVGGSIVAALMDQRWWLLVGFVFGGLALARLCYYGAISQAVAYGEQIRVGFDLYRSDVLKQMRIPLPTSAYEEYRVWQKLSLWTYDYVNPWEFRSSDLACDLPGSPPRVEPASDDTDLYYDNRKAPPDSDETLVSIGDTPFLTLTHKRKTDD